jgi:hypothetical protein
MVRKQVGLGRVLPLGGPGDAAWITEHAAAAVLRAAASAVGGIRLGALRIGPAEPSAPWPSEGRVNAPPSALPHRPLRVEAAFDAACGLPLPASADRLRRALWHAAHDGVGLAVTAVDLTVTGLLDDPYDADALPVSAPGGTPAGPPPVVGASGPAAVVAAVPGVAGLTSRLGGFAAGLGVRDVPAVGGRETNGGSSARRHVQAQIAVAAGHRALDVARAVRNAAASAYAVPDAPGPVDVAVVVTDAV